MEWLVGILYIRPHTHTETQSQKDYAFLKALTGWCCIALCGAYKAASETKSCDHRRTTTTSFLLFNNTQSFQGSDQYTHIVPLMLAHKAFSLFLSPSLSLSLSIYIYIVYIYIFLSLSLTHTYTNTDTFIKVCTHTSTHPQILCHTPTFTVACMYLSPGRALDPGACDKAVCKL